MILQYDVSSYQWIIGIGLTIALSLLFNHLTIRNFKALIGFLGIFTTFFVWSGFIPIWSLYLIMFIIIVIFIYEYKNKEGI